MYHRSALLLTLLAVNIGVSEAHGQENEPVQIYVGTYTESDDQGINLLEMDPDSGQITLKGVVATTENPSFLALHPSKPLLYAVNEVGQYEGESSGAISAFRIDPEAGKLTLINQQSSKGGAPCHIIVDSEGKNVLIANYSGGNVAVLPIEADGSLGEANAVAHEGSGPNPRRQEGPHAHSINLDATERFAVAADLGIDKYLVYRFDPESHSLTPNDPPASSVQPGAGPRHFDFHPSNRIAFGINELDSTVTAFRFDSEAGTLTETQTVTTLPPDSDISNSTADIHVHPSGKFLYGSNRGHNSIAMFRIDEKAATLTPIGHQSTGGSTPRNFVIDPSGRFLLAANQATGSIVVFRINQDDGTLEQTEFQVEVPSPVCLMFVPRGS
ncbi:lactonase family protein [Tautonia rosea]|uniref:lactonase family protein n=1 Tax=Tautonia rosea TaxID=2728037 RepID=UPI00147484C6|nr:lactonase family protein [Tautonia rosea]